MKKLLLSFALIAGTSVCIYAQTTDNNDGKTQATEIAVADMDDFKTVETGDLPAKVQETVNKLAEDNTVKAVAYNEETKQTQLTLVSKSDETEKVVVLDEEGNEVK